MDVQEIIAEFLYIGIVAEKGRCYNRHWFFSYKKTLTMHIEALYKLSFFLETPRLDVVDAINEFIRFCSCNSEISKFYPFYQKIVFETDVKLLYIEHKRIFRAIRVLLLDLLNELNKFFPSKKKVYYLLNALHNLPRVYFKNGGTLCGIRGCYINEDDALNYAFSNMNPKLRETYNWIFNY